MNAVAKERERIPHKTGTLTVIKGNITVPSNVSCVFLNNSTFTHWHENFQSVITT